MKTMEIIKNHAPKLHKAINSILDKRGDIKIIYDLPMVEHNNIAVRDLKELEQELQKAYGSEYPKMMLCKSSFNWFNDFIKDTIVAEYSGQFIGLMDNYNEVKEITTITKSEIIEALSKAGITDLETVKNLLNE